MKATMDARLFARALEKAAKAVYRRSPVPELEQVRVDVDGRYCRLTATNLNHYLEAILPAEGEAFSILFYNTTAVLKASKFFDGSLCLDYDMASGTLTMTCGPRSSRIEVSTVGSFPDFPEEEPRAVYHTNALALSKRFDRIKYAVGAPDPARQSLASVRFTDKRIAALDRVRMAVNTDDAEDALSVVKPFVLPVEAMTFLPLFGDNWISLKVGERWCMLCSRDLCLATKMLELDTFNIDGAIPTSAKETYDVNIKQFVGELKYLEALLPEKGRPPIKFADGTLTAYAPKGNHQSSIQLSGPATITYGFDGKLMLEGLGQFKGAETVTVKVSSPHSPIVLTNGGSDLALVLPVNLAKYENAA